MYTVRYTDLSTTVRKLKRLSGRDAGFWANLTEVQWSGRVGLSLGGDLGSKWRSVTQH